MWGATVSGRRGSSALVLAALLSACPLALAQGKTHPPVAQAWLDVATISGMGMPAGGMPSMGSIMGGMLGMPPGAEFLNTQHGVPGRWLDVTLRTRNNPALQRATQSVPGGSGLAPELALKSPEKAPAAPAEDDGEVAQEMERPSGRIKLYWGCGEQPRAGQPKVLELATASAADLQKFFTARRATKVGAHSALGRPHWPQAEDKRVMPVEASLVGTHAFRGEGVPAGFEFGLPPAQDLMPAIALRQSDAAGATLLEWDLLPSARAYFIAVMGAGGGESEMVLWTSSEVPETGFGLVDYQTNAAVDKWLKERVLLAPEVARCAIPAAVAGGGAMLRMIAYGSELNLAHPPRPADPKQDWKPDWAVKVRVKSVLQTMLGMDLAEAGKVPGEARSKPESPIEAIQKELVPEGAVKALKGLFGR